MHIWASKFAKVFLHHTLVFEAMCQLANSGLLGGMTLEGAMSKGMLFYQDYYTVLGSEIMSKAGHLQAHV